MQDCVQIHGGIGVTFEHDLHLYLRRHTLNRALYGTPADHRQRLADIVEHRRACADEPPHDARRTSRPSGPGPGPSSRATSDRPIRPTSRSARCATSAPTTRSWPRWPGTGRCSACCSTPAWPASASPGSTAARGSRPAHQRVLNEELAGYEYPARIQAPTLSPCAAVLLDFGTEEQKLAHIPAILRGEEIWMQFLSEPSGGSDVAGALTSAVRDGEEWVLNGSKIWTTGAWWSDWGLCLARTNWDVPKHRGLTVFILPIRQPGLEVHRIEMLNGSKEFCQEFLTDVRVPDSDRIGDVDDGWTVGTRWMFHERMLTNSPLVTVPAGTSHGGTGTGRWTSWPGTPVGSADPYVRDLVGEARMLERGRPPSSGGRIGEGIATGAMADQSAAIGRLFGGVATARRRTIAFEIAGPAGAAWTARRRRAGLRRLGLPDAAGVVASAAAPPRWPATSSASGCSGCRGSARTTATWPSATCPGVGRPRHEPPLPVLLGVDHGWLTMGDQHRGGRAPIPPVGPDRTSRDRAICPPVRVPAGAFGPRGPHPSVQAGDVVTAYGRIRRSRSVARCRS